MKQKLVSINNNNNNNTYPRKKLYFTVFTSLTNGFYTDMNNEYCRFIIIIIIITCQNLKAGRY